MKTKYFAIVLFSLLFSLLLHSQTLWERKNNGLPSGPWQGYSIDASGSRNAVISISVDGLYSTTDSGNTWNKVSLPYPENIMITDLSLQNDSLIWAATSNGQIIYSSDAGKNWAVQFSDTTKTKFMNYLKMFNAQNGIAFGDCIEGGAAALLKTTDGGTTWNVLLNADMDSVFSGDLWRRVDFYDIQNGCIFSSGVNPQKLIKTYNGGETWEPVEFRGYLQIVKCITPNIVLGAGNLNEQKGIYKFTRNEQTITFDETSLIWGEDFEIIPGDISRIYFLDAGKLYFSSDTGNTFSESMSMEPGEKGRDIVFTDENSGWLLADNAVYKLNNNDLSSSVNNDGFITPSSFSLMQNYPNPFNPSTIISFYLPENSFTILKVYDILGKEVYTLLNEELYAGRHEVKFNAESLAAGIYYYSLAAGENRMAKKMVLLK